MSPPPGPIGPPPPRNDSISRPPPPNIGVRPNPGSFPPLQNQNKTRQPPFTYMNNGTHIKFNFQDGYLHKVKIDPNEMDKFLKEYETMLMMRSRMLRKITYSNRDCFRNLQEINPKHWRPP